MTARAVSRDQDAHLWHQHFPLNPSSVCVCVCLRIYAWDNVVRQKCIVGSMSTPRPKLFILSAGLSTTIVETADQELYPHPHGFASSSPPRPSLPPFSLSLSVSLIISSPTRSFTATLTFTSRLLYFSNLFVYLSSTPVIQYISLPH